MIIHENSMKGTKRYKLDEETRIAMEWSYSRKISDVVIKLPAGQVGKS